MSLDLLALQFHYFNTMLGGLTAKKRKIEDKSASRQILGELSLTRPLQARWTPKGDLLETSTRAKEVEYHNDQEAEDKPCASVLYAESEPDDSDEENIPPNQRVAYDYDGAARGLWWGELSEPSQSAVMDVLHSYCDEKEIDRRTCPAFKEKFYGPVVTWILCMQKNGKRGLPYRFGAHLVEFLWPMKNSENGFFKSVVLGMDQLIFIAVGWCNRKYEIGDKKIGEMVDRCCHKEIKVTDPETLQYHIRIPCDLFVLHSLHPAAHVLENTRHVATVRLHSEQSVIRLNHVTHYGSLAKIDRFSHQMAAMLWRFGGILDDYYPSPPSLIVPTYSNSAPCSRFIQMNKSWGRTYDVLTDSPTLDSLAHELDVEGEDY